MPNTINTIDDIETYILPGSGPDVSVADNLEEAICGGWDVDDQVGSGLGAGNKIVKVTGAPGREGVPLGQPPLGMASRIESFIYPGDGTRTCGFTSVCRPKGYPGFRPDSRLTPPFYGTKPFWHPCERGLEGYRPDDNPGPSTKHGKVDYSCGGGEMQEISDPIAGFCAEANVGKEREDVNMAGTGNQDGALSDFGGLCQKLNEDWVYTLWEKPIRKCVPNGILHDYGHPAAPFATDPDTGEQIPIRDGCTSLIIGFRREKGACRKFDDADENRDDPWFRHSIRYCCSDGVYGGDSKNCVKCSGAECLPGGITATTIWSSSWNHIFPPLDAVYCIAMGGPIPTFKVCLPPMDTAYPRDYWSYFRHYIVSYIRDRVNAVIENGKEDLDEGERDDPLREHIPTACYGLWNENDNNRDPKNILMFTRQWRCVIAVYYPEGTPWQDQFYRLNDASETDMEDTQEGEGLYKLGKIGEDEADAEKYKDPPVRDGDRNDHPLWEQDLANSFSLLEGEKLRDDYDYDITVPLLDLDKGRQRATVQRGPYESQTFSGDEDPMEGIHPVSSGALMRATDDTVADINPQRTIVEWWQKMQTEMHTYFTPPVARLLLPPAWSVDLNPLHPLLTLPKLPDTSSPEWKENPLMQPIEVQLELREDLLGEVAQYLTDALLLNMEQERVSIVIPAGSATEYRALAQGWCYWWIAQNNTEKTCENISGKAEDMYNRLIEYADRIDSYRALRADMTATLAEYLDLHKTMNQHIGRWVLDNARQYQDYLNERETRFAQKQRWEQAQQEYRNFHDKTNMPWCKNDRYTTSIYSLLDPWWAFYAQSGAGGGPRDLSGPELPRPNLGKQPDMNLDFTHISISTGALRLPILKPIQVQLSLRGLDAPGSGVKNPENKVPPPLPPFGDISMKDDIKDNMPKIDSGSIKAPSTVAELKPNLSSVDIESDIQKARFTIRAMNEAYKTFWDSITKDPEDVEDWSEEDCYAPNTQHCVHIEYDLIERFTRMGARPAVHLLEDFLSIGDFRDPVNQGEFHCPEEDWTCQNLNPQYTRPRQGWGIKNPPDEEQDKFIDTLRTDRINSTLQMDLTRDEMDGDELKVMPYETDRKAILPTFGVPGEADIKLVPLDFPQPPPPEED